MRIVFLQQSRIYLVARSGEVDYYELFVSTDNSAEDFISRDAYWDYAP